MHIATVGLKISYKSLQAVQWFSAAFWSVRILLHALWEGPETM
jgi:hypothetical protein